ncbi:LCP family protein [Paractinoplanes brasiliensis]|uniref:LytR family transcriptional attenuator n=1 Tax=Paractinoplanes brasiliensis TaxID=52695 RepID=A0A4R6JWN5_9ACTN|nr:LCP family protein [Actinoplanes brasiliensis]TDO39596.1 LytR family transcriptional attenuator [Actinoplanes brasiliensis]GID29065.1 transcriptional regulator [Actinoplanes brasiliensis]
MSAPTSPYGSSGSGRASVPSSGRASARPASAYRGNASPPQRDNWPPRGAAGGGGGGTPPGDPGRGTSYRGRRPKPKWGRIALLAGLAVLIIAVIAGISLYGYASGLDKDLKRTDAFNGISADRPAKPIEGAQNILLVGSDSRDPDAKDDGAGKWRADTLILMHIPEDHKSAQLISIPRDLWVVVPRSNDAACGDGGRAKINAAFAFGGLPRAVHTVECLTDVKIDHVMAIDFGGFKEVTDALGGVDLKVEQTITSIHKPYRVFKKGTMHMDGAQALDWVRQRKQFARGDFARMQHQQEFLKAIMDKAASSGTITNPAKLNAFLKAVTAAVTVDNDFSLTDMATEMRGIRGSNLTFITSPNKGSDTINGQSVVVSDKEKALALFKAVAADEMDTWMAANLKKGSAGTSGS